MTTPGAQKGIEVMTLRELIDAPDLPRLAEEVAQLPHAHSLRSALRQVMAARQEFIEANAAVVARRADLGRQREAAAAPVLTAEQQIAAAQADVARVESELAAIADVAIPKIDSDDVFRVSTALLSWRDLVNSVR